MTDASNETNNFGIADHHFEAAGIPLDDKPVIEGEAKEIKDETGTESGVQKEVAKEENKEPTVAPKDSNGSGTDGDDKQKQEEKPAPVNRPEPELDQEQYSELVNGKPVRPEVAGRWYHQRNTARQERDAVNDKYKEVSNQVTQLQGQVEAYKTAATAIGNLAPAEVPKAARLYEQLKANPVATLKQMLVEAKANGHNIDGIGEGVDTAAVQRMLDQRLAALEGKKETPVKETVAPTVDNDDDLFIQAYPDAIHHMDIYLDMLKRNPQATNTQLYFSAKNWADSNGYDYSKPLKPQIEARNKSQTPEPKPTPKTEDNTPRLSGRTEAPEPLITTGGKEESFKDIIAKALRDNPLQT